MKLQLKHAEIVDLDSYTGPAGEVVVNASVPVIAVHDGLTPGGKQVRGTRPVIETPTILSPLAGAMSVPHNAVFTASRHFGTGYLTASHWEFARDTQFQNMVHASERVTVSPEHYRPVDHGGQLTVGVTYYVRVRYEDNLAGLSAWSKPVPFSVAKGIPSRLIAELRTPNPENGANFGWRIGLNETGSLLAISARNETVDGLADVGRVYIYSRSGVDLTLVQTLTPPAELMKSDLLFGSGLAVSADGTTLAVGAVRAHRGTPADRRGAVVIYTQVDGVWTQAQIVDKPDSLTHVGFADEVTLSRDGTYLSVSAPYVATQAVGAGANYIFRRVAGTYTHDATLQPAAEHATVNANFGVAPCFSSDGLTLALGAHREGSMEEGAAYVYSRVGTTWTLQRRLANPAPGYKVRFGWGLSLSQDAKRLAVGAFKDSSHGRHEGGAVYVYDYVEGSWSLKADLYPGDVQNRDHFGASVAMSADGKLIYAPSDVAMVDGVSRAGALYAFEFNGVWMERHKLTTDPLYVNDWLGHPTAMAANGSVVASHVKNLDYDGYTTVGAVVIYT